MRNGRRSDRNKVRWLVKFIEVWCTPDEVDGMANAFVEKIKSGNVYDKYAYHLAEAYSQKVSSAELQDEILRITKKYLEECKSDLSCQISDSDMKFVMKEIYPNLEKQNALTRLELLQERASNTGVLEFFQGHIYLRFTEDFDSALSQFQKSAEKGFSFGLFSLGFIYKEMIKDFKKAEMYFLKAIEKGDKDSFYELADLYYSKLDQKQLAKTYYLKAVEVGDVSTKANAYFYLGLMSQDTEDDMAEKYYRDSFKLGGETSKVALLNLLISNKEKKKALDFINELEIQKEFVVCKVLIIFCWIWDNKIESAIKHLNEMLNEFDLDFEVLINVFKEVIHLLISKKQYNFVLKLFENRRELKDRFKPTYYALMTLMKDQFPDEYLKMGSELEEPVNKVLEEIKQFEKVYV
jgi:TPR repeat protein